MKALYTSPAGDFLATFGFARTKPVEVEILEIDYEKRRARIREPLSGDCMANIARKVKGMPPLLFAVSSVSLDYLEFGADQAE